MTPPQPIPYPADPADPFLFIMEMQSTFNRRHGSSVISKGIGRNNPAELPAFPPAFPDDCDDMLYRPGVFDGTPFAPDRFCRMFLPTSKPWNPNDPCLLEAAEEYWRNYDELDKIYYDLARNESRTFTENMERVERERVECRARCGWSFCFFCCETTCDEEAMVWKNRYQAAYDRYMADLVSSERSAKQTAQRRFWADAMKCGYDGLSFGLGGVRDWGGTVPFFREQTQA